MRIFVTQHHAVRARDDIYIIFKYIYTHRARQKCGWRCAIKKVFAQESWVVAQRKGGEAKVIERREGVCETSLGYIVVAQVSFTYFLPAPLLHDERVYPFLCSRHFSYMRKREHALYYARLSLLRNPLQFSLPFHIYIYNIFSLRLWPKVTRTHARPWCANNKFRNCTLGRGK